MSAKSSSRSRQGSETSTRSHWSRPSTRRKSVAKDDKDDNIAGELKDDEHRKRRIVVKERSKSSRSDPDKPDQTRTKSRSSKAGSEKSRRSVKSKSSSDRGEDSGYYKPGQVSSSARSHSPPRRPSSHRTRSSPAALELEVTPDDSISQVGAKQRSIRPSTRRRSTYAKLGRIPEDDTEQDMPHAPSKRRSLFGALFGRQRKTDDIPARDSVRYDHSLQDSRRRLSHIDEHDNRRSYEQHDEDLPRRMQSMNLGGLGDKRYARQRAEAETWGVGNAAGHLMNDDFVPISSKLAMSTFGDAKMGRRGERASGRRRRPKMEQKGDDAGLVPNFLGDQSVLGFAPFAPRASRYSR